MRARLTVVIALAIGVLLAGAGAAAAQDGRGNDTSAELREAVTVPGIKEHLLALQRIGQGFRGNRLAGTPGYDASANYVALRALRAGFAVSEFDFDYELGLLADWTPPILAVRGGEQFVPGIAGSIPGGDFGSMVNSPSGDLTAPVWAADLTLPSPAPNSSDSGCEAADFAGMPAGAIVLIQRGTCAIVAKWLNAQAAGAGRDRVHQRGQPRPRAPQWFDLAGVGRRRFRWWPRRSPPSSAWPAASPRASSARPRGSASTGARARIRPAT